MLQQRLMIPGATTKTAQPKKKRKEKKTHSGAGVGVILFKNKGILDHPNWEPLW